MNLLDAHRHPPAPAVGRAFLCAVDERDWEAVLSAAAERPGLRPFLGVHPWRAQRLTPETLARLDALLAAHPRAGIGECGLDRAKPDAPWDTQMRAFEAQLALAVRHRRPLNLHAVRATDALLGAFKAAGAQGRPAILHGFRGGPALARQLVAAGFTLSFPPALLDPEQAALRDAFRGMPDDRFLLETDAPNTWGGLPAVLGLREPPSPETMLTLLHHDAAALRRTTPDALAGQIEANAALFAD